MVRQGDFEDQSTGLPCVPAKVSPDRANDDHQVIPPVCGGRDLMSWSMEWTRTCSECIILLL